MGLFLNDEEYQEELKYWQQQFTTNCKRCNGTLSVQNKNGGYNQCGCVKRTKIFANLISNGIPKAYINWRWNDCVDAQVSVIEQCKQYVQQFNDNFSHCRGMYIFGTQGVGKTTLATIIAKDIALTLNPKTGRYYNTAFVTYDKLLFWNNNFNMQSKLDTFIRKAELAIIDNVGSEVGNQQNITNILDRILRERRNIGFPTIITSNFTMDEIKEHYSGTIKDFIKQSFNQMHVCGHNIRAKDDDNKSFNRFGSLGG